MIDNNTLENLGLNSKEAAVYVKCLEFGPLSIARLAQLSGIQRTYLYDITKNLIGKGFLAQTQTDGKKVFSAAHPRDILRSQKEKLKQFEATVPELESLATSAGARPQIVYYEGVRELEKMMAGAIFGRGECLIFNDELFFTKENQEYQKKNIAQRLRTGTSCRVLAGLSSAALESAQRDKKEARVTRLLPKDLFDPKVHVALYRDKTLIVNHADNFGFVVEDQGFADTLKMLFELIWKSGRIITK
jgi:sugar-specific transcriptional regulator TrmB